MVRFVCIKAPLPATRTKWEDVERKSRKNGKRKEKIEKRKEGREKKEREREEGKGKERKRTGREGNRKGREEGVEEGQRDKRTDEIRYSRVKVGLFSWAG